MDARAPRYGVCDASVEAPLGSGEHPSAVIRTETGEKIQGVAAFQERLKGRIMILKPVITRLRHVECDGRIFASQEKFTDEEKEEKSRTLPGNFRSSKVKRPQNRNL